MDRHTMWMGLAVAAGITLGVVATAADAQQKPPPQPTPSPAARDNSQAAQLPAGVDTGVPGSAQNAPLGTESTGPIQRARLDPRRSRTAAAAASGAPRPAVNDSAAARLAARKPTEAAAPAASRAAPK